MTRLSHFVVSTIASLLVLVLTPASRAGACESVIIGGTLPPSVVRISGAPARWRSPCRNLPSELLEQLGPRNRGRLVITGFVFAAGSTSFELAETQQLMANVMNWLLQQDVPRSRVTFGPYVLVMNPDDPAYLAEEGGNWVELSIER